MASRRKFIESSALSLGSAGFLGLSRTSQDFGHRVSVRKSGDIHKLQMGIAGFTFNHFSVDEAIAMMQKVAISNLSIKDFHLPLNSSPEKIAEVLGKFKMGQITIYAAGVIYMKTNGEVDQAFEYAKNIGVNLIIGSPTYDLLPYVEQKVKAQHIRMAIHNHGPEDKWYPGPKDIYDRIKSMDAGMGICLDIGHAVRNGVDPARAVRDCGPRILDMHVKDVTAAKPDGKAIEVGRGVINFTELEQALIAINYKGMCSIEYEKEGQDPLPGIAESAGFFKGVESALS